MMNEIKNAIYCSTHPDQQVIYINSDLKSKKSPFNCAYCVVDQDRAIDTNTLVSLGQLMSHDQSMIVNNWPIIGDKSITNEMKNISTDLQECTNYEEKIRKFFYSFREQILKKMDELECQFIEVESSLRKMRVDTLNAYNQLTSKQTIRDIIFSDHFKIEDKNEQITQIIEKIISEQTNIKKDLSKSIEDIDIKNTIDFKIMDNAQENFIKNISSIKNFMDFNNQTMEISKFNNSNQQQAFISQINQNLQESNIYQNNNEAAPLKSGGLFGNINTIPKINQPTFGMFGGGLTGGLTNQNPLDSSIQQNLNQTAPYQGGDMFGQRRGLFGGNYNPNINQQTQGGIFSQGLIGGLTNQNQLDCSIQQNRNQQIGCGLFGNPKTIAKINQPAIGLLGSSSGGQQSGIQLFSPQKSNTQQNQNQQIGGGLFGNPEIIAKINQPAIGLFGSSSGGLTGGLTKQNPQTSPLLKQGMFGNVQFGNPIANVTKIENVDQKQQSDQNEDQECNKLQNSTATITIDQNSQDKLIQQVEQSECSNEVKSDFMKDDEIKAKEETMNQQEDEMKTINIKQTKSCLDLIDSEIKFIDKQYSQDLFIINEIKKHLKQLKSKVLVIVPKSQSLFMRYGISIHKIEKEYIHILKLRKIKTKQQIIWLLPDIEQNKLIQEFKSFYIYDFLENKAVHEPVNNQNRICIISLQVSNQVEYYKIRQDLQDVKNIFDIFTNFHIQSYDIIQNICVRIQIPLNHKNNLVSFQEIIIDEDKDTYDWEEEFLKLEDQIKWTN